MDFDDQNDFVEEEENKHNKHFGVRVQGQEANSELKLGTIAHSDDEAYNLYNNYALNKGFSVRKGRVRYKQGTKIVCERTFYCSKQGKKLDNVGIQVENVDSRTECKAEARFKVENGVWELDRLFSEHNHDLVPSHQRHLLRSSRNLHETSKSVIDSMAVSGIRPMMSYRYLVKEAGGVQNLGHTKIDHLNHCNRIKKEKIKVGDAQSLVNHFKRRQAENPMFFYAVQLDDDKRLKNFFWRDGLSKMDYECFGDVVVFDTTYRTNRYNMICAPFVGVNHHWKNVFFGCAFLSDEKTETFVWLLETFKLAMGNKPPKSIFTDQDHAMKSAIKEVFPNTRHRLCLWHILKNAGHHLSHIYQMPGFKAKFNKLFYSCESDLEFEYIWIEMVEQYGVDNNKWLNGLYNIRKNWCPAFSLDTFSCNIHLTQRSECTNNVFQQMACKTMALTEFVNHYDNKAEEMREDEISEDYNSDRGRPYMRVKCGIIEHAAEVYTHRVFHMFQEEFLKSLSEKVISSSSNDGICSTYELKKEGQRRLHTVNFNSWNSAVHCTCKMFEAKGWLCCHALRVLNSCIGVEKIPQQYILERWRKHAKKEIMMEIFQTTNAPRKPSKTIRLNKLMRKAFFVMNLSSEDENTEGIADEFMDQILDKIEKYTADLNANSNLNVDKPTEQANLIPVSDREILDPPCKRAKGEKNARHKDPMEKNSKGKKKSSKQTSQSFCETSSSKKSMSSTKQNHPNINAMTNTFYEHLTVDNMDGSVSQSSKYHCPYKISDATNDGKQ